MIRAPGFNNLPAPGEEIIMSYLPHSEIASQTVRNHQFKLQKQVSKHDVNSKLANYLQTDRRSQKTLAFYA